MSEQEDVEPEEAPAKASKLPLVLGLVLALVGAGGGFFATWSGMILGPEASAETAAVEEEEPVPEVAFLPVDPIVVSLSGKSEPAFLRFRAQLEVPANKKSDVETLMPRVVDVLNSYLRALRTADIEDPNALARLRSQMLRRIKIVAGENRVNDVLVMEFVIN